jgi:hypothetical protein
MTQQDIQERNKQIATMLGLKRGWWISQNKPLTDDKKQWLDVDSKTSLGTRVYYDKDLAFHSDWNWIMEAIVFIGKELEYFPQLDYPHVRIKGWEHGRAWYVDEDLEYIEVVFIAVSDFAKHRNEQVI